MTRLTPDTFLITGENVNDVSVCYAADGTLELKGPLWAFSQSYPFTPEPQSGGGHYSKSHSR